MTGTPIRRVDFISTKPSYVKKYQVVRRCRPQPEGHQTYLTGSLDSTHIGSTEIYIKKPTT